MKRWGVLVSCLSFVVSLVLVDCSSAAGGEAQDHAQSKPAAKAPGVANANAAAAARAKMPRVTLSPAGRDPVTVRVEVMRTSAERERGLMFRRQLDADAGMLFVFERPQQLTFWMHNTYLPLDMIFVAADMTILGTVENATPLTDDPRRVPGMSQYVLEVNAGFSRRNGLQAGTVVRFSDLPAESAK